MSGNLGITQVVASQNQKEVTINAALLALDAAITETFDANVSAASVTLTNGNYRGAVQVRATNATSAGRTVTLPQVERVTILRNDPATSTQPVGFVRGSTTLTLGVGETVVARTDGTANGLVPLLWGHGRRDNMAATTNPGATNDSTQGYAVGSMWFNATGSRISFCVDASAGAAVWRGVNVT